MKPPNNYCGISYNSLTLLIQNQKIMEQNKIVIYQTKDGQTQIDVRMENETVWLSANQMAILFGRDEKTIRKHINNVFTENEVPKDINTNFFCVLMAQGTA